MLNYIRRYLRRKTEPIRLLQTLAPPELRLRTLVHVGAHLAQERHLYESCGYRDVLWVEGSPEVFGRLQSVLENHQGSARHKTCCALLTDSDGEVVALRGFSNDGKSNSIFSPTQELRSRWPAVGETGVIENVRSRTLDSLLRESGYAETCDVLIVDVQGAELLVLRGAETTLASVSAVIVEVSTRAYYEGGVLYPEVRAFMEARGFSPMSTPRRHGDMLFLRNSLLRQSAAA